MSIGPVSADGRWVWNGAQWVPNAPSEFAYYAGFWRRAAGLIIDGILLFTADVLIGAAVGVLVTAAGAADRGAASLAVYPFEIVAAWMYAALMISSSNQATLGQMALGIKVTDLNGQRLTFGRATGRHFASWLSTLLCWVGGYLFVFFTSRQQTLHDLIAGTVVVRREIAPGAVGQTARGSGGAGAAVAAVVAFGAILVLVSIVVLVILLTMGNQIKNVFSNVVVALGS